MKGIELCEKYYFTYGKPMLEQQFADILPYIAVGLVGSGSDKYGYDDEVSRDHDFEPGFCIFIPDESIVNSRTQFLLERAYSKLPKSFEGVDRQILSPVGGNRNGVIRTCDFYTNKVGGVELSTMQWLAIPQYYLSEATNGKVLYDGYGEFTRIRNYLLNMPIDVKRKRIAGELITMAQSGQYNYSRCLAHGENEGAQLAANIFCESAAKITFLLNDKYMPFYKWAFRALRELDNDFFGLLSKLLGGDIYDSVQCEIKSDTIKHVCDYISDKLISKGFTNSNSADLEKQAYCVNDAIRDGELRNMSIFAAV